MELALSSSPYKIVKNCFSLALFLSFLSGAILPAEALEQKLACKTFVQDFYNWYFAKTTSPIPKNSSPLDIALKLKKDAFSPELLRQLKADIDAQTKVPDEIVGLDFDPILNTQSQADRYQVGNVTAKGKSFLVEVYGFWDKKKSPKPDVIPELISKDGKWQFVNFRYQNSGDSDLLSVLKTLRAERGGKK
ncbi:MAG: YbjP/YqhG family protein [Candidatus Obscuribacterales bacterium]|nr:YbjP/YqhG family protein [Candidatus Obscuribacterales bacterium]